MAPAEPDTSSLATPAQVFSPAHTLPQIRAIHRALHAQIDDKAARLRTQVGGSYRELLGTAEAIVRMRADNDDLQRRLAGLGRRCGQVAVKAKAVGLGRFGRRKRDYGTEGAEAEGDEQEEELGRAARARLLRECTLLVGRVLRGRRVIMISPGLDEGRDRGAAGGGGGGGRLLLATKVLLLSRLLASQFGEKGIGPDEETAWSVDSSKKMLLSLRRRILRSVNVAIERGGGGGGGDGGNSSSSSSENLLSALCAYSLVTSSGARDTLQHLLSVRQEAISLTFDFRPGPGDGRREQRGDGGGGGGGSGGGAGGAGADAVLSAMRLYTRTLLEAQELAPVRLQEGLGALTRHALLADGSLRRLESLRLDIYERWCREDVEHFTPFIIHDDLEPAQARHMLATWAQETGEILIAGLKTALERIAEFRPIVQLRTSVLRLWVRDGAKIRGLDPDRMKESLRSALLLRLLGLVDAKVAKLHIVGSEISSTLATGTVADIHHHSRLWDTVALGQLLATADGGGGAVRYIRDVADRLHGRSEAVSRAVAAYGSWRGVAAEVQAVVDELGSQRWENDGEDADEIEDEETIEARTRQLSGEDPRRLAARLDEGLAAAFGDLESLIANLWSEERDHGRGARAAAYLLRILRDIRIDLPALGPVRGFGLALVPSMHATVAEAAARGPVEAFTGGFLGKDPAAAAAAAVAAMHPLWDGEPPLPGMPSVGVFGFLRDLESAMASAGTDLWSARAVGVLKGVVAGRVVEEWGDAVRRARADDGHQTRDGMPDRTSSKSEAAAEGSGVSEEGRQVEERAELGADRPGEGSGEFGERRQAAGDGTNKRIDDDGTADAQAENDRSDGGEKRALSSTDDLEAAGEDGGPIRDEKEIGDTTKGREEMGDPDIKPDRTGHGAAEDKNKGGDAASEPANEMGSGACLENNEVGDAANRSGAETGDRLAGRTETGDQVERGKEQAGNDEEQRDERPSNDSEVASSRGDGAIEENTTTGDEVDKREVKKTDRAGNPDAGQETDEAKSSEVCHTDETRDTSTGKEADGEQDSGGLERTDDTGGIGAVQEVDELRNNMDEVRDLDEAKNTVLAKETNAKTASDQAGDTDPAGNQADGKSEISHEAKDTSPAGSRAGDKTDAGEAQVTDASGSRAVDNPDSGEAQGKDAAGSRTGDKTATADEAEDTNDAGSKADNEQKQKAIDQSCQHLFVQWAFDAAFLQHYLGPSNPDITALRDEILSHARLDEPSRQRVARAAQDYYARTSLLFGLLSWGGR